MEESNPFSFFSFFERPNTLNFDEENVAQNDRLSQTERCFLLNVIKLTREDPTIPRFVFEVRTKLGQGQKLTNDEANRLLRELACKDFPKVKLDLSEMKFPELDMSDGIVGNLEMEKTEIAGNLCQNRMIIDNLNQIGMKVHGDLLQVGLRTRYGVFKGACFQNEMSVDGLCDQAYMEIGDNLVQSNMQVGGNLWQDHLKSQLGLYQNGVRVGGECSQKEANIGGSAIHDEMNITGDFDETHKRTGTRTQNAVYSTKNLRVVGERKTSELNTYGQRL